MVSDEQWEAADYAEPQMNGREDGELLPCTLPGRAGFQVAPTVEDCVPVQGAWKGGKRGFPSLSTWSISPGAMTRDGLFSAKTLESQGTHLSFDPS